jgi:hypothetical protein
MVKVEPRGKSAALGGRVKLIVPAAAALTPPIVLSGIEIANIITIANANFCICFIFYLSPFMFFYIIF